MKKLEVRFQINASEYRVIGVLAEDAHAIYFEYDPIFLTDPMWLSPFKLKPKPGLIKHKIDGEGRAPLRKHVLSLAQQFAIEQVDAKDIIEEVCQGVMQWTTLAKDADVDKKHRKEIEKRIVSNVKLLMK